MILFIFITIIIIIGIIIFTSIKRWKEYNKIVLNNVKISQGWQKPLDKVNRKEMV